NVSPELIGEHVTGPAASSGSVAFVVQLTTAPADDVAFAVWSPAGLFVTVGAVVSCVCVTVTSNKRCVVFVCRSVDWQSSCVTPTGNVSPEFIGEHDTGLEPSTMSKAEIVQVTTAPDPLVEPPWSPVGFLVITGPVVSVTVTSNVR